MSSEDQNFEHRAELVIADDRLSAMLSITPGQPDKDHRLRYSFANFLEAQGIDSQCAYYIDQNHTAS